MKDRYTLDNISRAIRDPSLLWDEVLRLNRYLNNKLYAGRYGPGFDIFEENWDTLFIIDGCRWDVYKEHALIPGNARGVLSKGAHSREFMRRQFFDRVLHDTVYITSNPWSEQIADDVFFLTRTTYTEENKGGTSRLPEDVAALAKRTFAEYPEKRYIVHFMQPNNPYVGPIAENLRESLLRDEGVLCTEMGVENADEYHEPKRRIPHLRRACQEGYISQAEMFEVYVENLNIVTEYVEEVADYIGGKTALTADHGDMFGERLPPLYLREYSHFDGVYSEELRRVPWVDFGSKDRRSVRADPPIKHETLEESDVTDHLESMGYLSG